MRILAISHLFPHAEEPRYGIFVARQLLALRRLGVEITVIVPRVWCPAVLRQVNRWKGYNHTTAICEFDGLDIFTVPYIRPPGNWYNNWSGLAVYMAAKSRILDLHKGKNFDLIYATDLFPDGDAAVRFGKLLNIPSSCLFIGGDVNITAGSTPALYKRFTTLVADLDGLLTCGMGVEEGIRAVTSKEIVNVYGTVDLQEFSPLGDKSAARASLGVPKDAFIVLFAGYLMRRKGVYELLEAFSRLHQRASVGMLVMCGAGPEEAKLNKLACDNNMGQVVKFAGDVTPDQMSQWMRASDLFVLPSYTEGMPNAVMEAMACGLPVVTTNVGGLPEAIGDCDGAILVAPRDVDALQLAMGRVMADSELRCRMGKAGRMRAEQRFGTDRNAHVILNYFKRIVVRRHCGDTI